MIPPNMAPMEFPIPWAINSLFPCGRDCVKFCNITIVNKDLIDPRMAMAKAAGMIMGKKYGTTFSGKILIKVTRLDKEGIANGISPTTGPRFSGGIANLRRWYRSVPPNTLKMEDGTLVLCLLAKNIISRVKTVTMRVGIDVWPSLLKISPELLSLIPRPGPNWLRIMRIDVPFTIPKITGYEMFLTSVPSRKRPNKI